MKHRLNADVWTLAFLIALFPPLWAVLAPYVGVTTGAVALICAGLYAANGNKRTDAVRISAGFLLGDLWAVLALKIMDLLPFSASLELFITLFLLGGLAVLISGLVPKFIFCPAWLCGWAIGLTVLSPVGLDDMGTLPIEIGAAMLVGVWYVGAFVDLVQKKWLRFLSQKSKRGE